MDRASFSASTPPSAVRRAVPMTVSTDIPWNWLGSNEATANRRFAAVAGLLRNGHPSTEKLLSGLTSRRRE